MLSATSACSSWQKELLSGTSFQHQIVYPGPTRPADSGPLHIYIHGDGVPFVTPDTVAADPSPKRPYVLRLMALDRHPSVLLGRPCYFQARAQTTCQPKWWTTHRYAADVVDSLAATANQIAKGREVVLIGYSGGGTLAMLMAPAVEQLRGVITIAANLDIDQWTALHGYTRLHGSLNPSRQSQTLVEIAQVHYAGSDDQVVPPSLAQGFAAHFAPGSIRFVANQDHDCCWHRQWPELLDQALTGF